MKTLRMVSLKYLGRVCSVQGKFSFVDKIKTYTTVSTLFQQIRSKERILLKGFLQNIY